MSSIEEWRRSYCSLYERILGRVSVHDVINPSTGEIIVAAGEEITEAKAKAIDESPLEMIEIRSVLTCESNVVYVKSVMVAT